jgi:hypothetical protein
MTALTPHGLKGNHASRPCFPDSVSCPGLSQRRADAAEYRVDGVGYIVDTAHAYQCDQGDQQCILNQILALFAVLQAQEFHKLIHKHIAHFVVLLIGVIPARAGELYFASTISRVFHEQWMNK